MAMALELWKVYQRHVITCFDCQDKMREGTKPEKGWSWMVMITSLGMHTVNGCFIYAMGIIHNALLDQFEESVTLTSWAGSLVLRLVSFTDYKRTSYYFPNSIIQKVSKINIKDDEGTNDVLIQGLGLGLTYVTSVVVVRLNFEKKKNSNFISSLPIWSLAETIVLRVTNTERKFWGEKKF
ncbi:hypothetical protein KUTeg_001333 [Tegillarca granosa]|uniref:Uncharacterized protein n=1 Tax=Tegillarca granosa TaxID=220873 RepID=A0ABQ9FR59_TEGGR|nr:hypothetical protein KUTeg_001333 [Tegillarca granosa]